MRPELALAAAVDWLVGEPPGPYHPVRLMGQHIQQLEEALYGDDVARGALLAAGVVLPWAAVGTLVGRTLSTATALAARDLAVHARAVAWALDGSLEEGREAVSAIVGRDTGGLDEAGVIRACVEAVGESTCDGVIAPMFYGAAGRGTALAYRAANTLDSMVGHDDERYLHFGRASAKLDDALNYVPARLTGLLMCWAADLTNLDAAGARRIYERDRDQHPSPNSAHGMAAMAGALGLRLCGPVYYNGELHEKPWIGDDINPPSVRHIHQAVDLMVQTHVLATTLLAVLAP